MGILVVVMLEKEELGRRGKVGVGLTVAVVVAWGITGVMGKAVVE